MFDNITKVLGELIATTLLIFFGCMGCIGFTEAGPPPLYITAINVGLTVMFVIQMFGCVSGAHINPCVTIAAVIYRLMPVPLAAAYFVAQFLGAYLGYGLLKLLTPKSIWQDAICTTRPFDELSTGQAFAIEYIATMVLICVCCAVWDPRNARNTDTIPIRFGLTVAGISIVTLQYTGGSMNPTRSLAPELWSEAVHERHWVCFGGFHNK
jgi:aquaporin related protein